MTAEVIWLFLVTHWEISWLAAVFTLWGKHLIGSKRRCGWWVEIIAGLFWHYIAWSHEIWGQLAMSLIIQGMNVRGLILWSKDATRR